MELKIYEYESLGSTNDKAMQLVKEGCKEGTVVISHEQTKGRGRRGRDWSSKKGEGIYMSIVLRPELSPNQCPMLTLVAALAVTKVFLEMEGVEAKIKWPNDIVINGKKLCGILTEMSMNGMEMEAVIVGIGINVHQKAFQGELQEKATSLDLESGVYYPRELLQQEVLKEFENYYKRFLETGDFRLLQPEYESHLVNKGKQVVVLDPKGKQEGIAKGITTKGELIVETEKGEILVSNGEVSVRGIYGYV